MVALGEDSLKISSVWVMALLVCPKAEQNKDRISSVAHVRLLEQLLSEGTREAFAFSVYVFIKIQQEKDKEGSSQVLLPGCALLLRKNLCSDAEQAGGVLTGSTKH